jgi:hypothetical protein
MNLHVEGEEKLGVCEVCGCQPLKIHVPYKHITVTPHLKCYQGIRLIFADTERNRMAPDGFTNYQDRMVVTFYTSNCALIGSMNLL